MEFRNKSCTINQNFSDVSKTSAIYLKIFLKILIYLKTNRKIVTNLKKFILSYFDHNYQQKFNAKRSHTKTLQRVSYVLYGIIKNLILYTKYGKIV